MDPITSAVVAVLPGLAAETATSAIRDAYLAFKELVKRKWGDKGDLTRSLESLEQAPRSEELAKNLQKHVSECGLQEDEQIMLAIKRLTDALTGSMLAPAGPTVNFEQSGGTFTGVGAIANNKGDIRIG